MIAYRDGEEVGPYQVVQVLGRGSFGVVLLAEDSSQPPQRFALKLVPCDHLDAAAAARARDTALREAEMLQRLRHPHVVTCHQVCWDEERRMVWLALDFMDGGDLQTLIEQRRRGGESPPEAPFLRRVISAIGSALRYIHSQGVLHRDVKSSNVLLSRDPAGGGVLGEIKLADFGISKLLECTVQAHTVVGTPPYMSPELVRGEPYGTASDAWAFGVVLFELAALRRPFDAGNQLALVRQIVEQRPVPLPPGIAPDVARAINGLLEKDPQQRLHLAEALALSTAIRGMVPLPPPPSFPPPASPGKAEPQSGARFETFSSPGRATGAADVLTINEADAAPSAPDEILRVISDVSAGAVSEEELVSAQLVEPQLSAQSGTTALSRAQALGLSPRPGVAFSEPEDDASKSAKEKQRASGRRWLPRFGMALRGSSSKPGTTEGEPTVISAFESEPSSDGNPGASQMTKWTGSLLSSPRH